MILIVIMDQKPHGGFSGRVRRRRAGQCRETSFLGNLLALHVYKDES